MDINFILSLNNNFKNGQRHVQFYKSGLKNVKKNDIYLHKSRYFAKNKKNLV